MKIDLPTIAGTISTIIFAVSTMPMLIKAFRTKNLKSYSLGNILLANIGNGIYSIYVFNLPVGPIWLLHGFHLVTTGMMLVWYLRYETWLDLSSRFQGLARDDKVQLASDSSLQRPHDAQTPFPNSVGELYSQKIPT